MKRFYFGKDKKLKKAFETYENAETAMQQKGASANDTSSYVNEYEENPAEEKIYQFIKKMPINNPRKKARRICITIFSAAALCILAVCLRFYFSDAPKRYTKVLADIYKSSGTRMPAPESLQLDDHSLYHYHYLTEEEKETLEGKGESFEEEDLKGRNLIDENEFIADSLQAYLPFDRKTREYILVNDGHWALGRFSGYEMNGEAGKEASDPENAHEMLKNIFGITSAEDIKSVKLERTTAKSRQEPEKRVALWTGKNSMEWFYAFFSKKLVVLKGDTYHLDEEIIKKLRPVSGEEMLDEKEDILTDDGNSIWGFAEQIAKRPESTYYLAIENRLGETLLLGIIPDGEKTEVWIEPIANDYGYESGERNFEYGNETDYLQMCWSLEAIAGTPEQILLNEAEQKELSQVLNRVMDE